MAQTKLHELSQLGQSVWLDFIQRSLIQSGDLLDYLKRKSEARYAEIIKRLGLRR